MTSMRASLLSAALMLALTACSGGGSTLDKACKATSDCSSGQLCSGGTCKKTCSATTDCKAGQDCRQGAASDTGATCNAVSYSQPAHGGFGTDCALYACNGGDNPCADGFTCRAVNKCDPYAVCSTTCKDDRDCAAEFYCSATVDSSTSGTACTKNEDCDADAFCAVTSNGAGSTIRICEKKMCAPRTRCSECATDSQCRGTDLQKSYVCGHDNIGGRFCGSACNSDRDCLKPYKAQTNSGGLIEYGQFEKCLPDTVTGVNVCTPQTGACHGKSSIATISGDGQVCSPCRPDRTTSDCASGLGCYTSGSLENFCTESCTFLVVGEPDGQGDYTNFMTVPESDSCPSGSHCAFGNVVYPGTCQAGCKVNGQCQPGGTCADALKCGYCPQPAICTADPDNTGATCALKE